MGAIIQASKDRFDDARLRAENEDIRTYMVMNGEEYQVESSTPGHLYKVYRIPARMTTTDHGGWACTCTGWTHTGLCKHIGAVANRAEREGWAIHWTDIAPTNAVVSKDREP